MGLKPKSDAWTELHFENKTPYRWVRYEAPAGSHGYVADVEFYAGAKKLAGQGFGSKDSPGGRWRGAVDGNTTTLFYSDVADNQYAGSDIPRLIAPILDGRAEIVVGDRDAAAAPHFSPVKRRLQGVGSQVVRSAERPPPGTM